VELEFQEKYIVENLACGFIQVSTSPYSIPVFYKPKKDGLFCPLFDYQKINDIMVKDISPLPRITTILEDMGEMIKFSKFNLREGYYNVGVDEDSQDLLAFKTVNGLYAPIVMPMGPSNCLTAMQQFMNHVFTPLYTRYSPCFKNYMDDCLIATKEGEDELH
jgi:hypothetical protein